MNHWHSTESNYYYYLHNKQHLYKHNFEALLHKCLLQDNYTLRNDKFEDIILRFFI